MDTVTDLPPWEPTTQDEADWDRQYWSDRYDDEPDDD
jgi:hypothetical protein